MVQRQREGVSSVRFGGCGAQSVRDDSSVPRRERKGGRLLLINALIKHGLPPLNVELKNRKQYYEALREYQTNGNLRPMLDLMLEEHRRLKAALKR